MTSYNPAFSLAMIAARTLSDTMTGAAVHSDAEREADLKQAFGEFVKLGEMLIALRAPKPAVSNAQIIPIDRARRVGGLATNRDDLPTHCLSPLFEVGGPIS